MKKLNETSSSGATSSGNIASVATGLNHSIIKRMPPTNIFGGYSPVPDNTLNKKSKKNGK